VKYENMLITLNDLGVGDYALQIKSIYNEGSITDKFKGGDEILFTF